MLIKKQDVSKSVKAFFISGKVCLIWNVTTVYCYTNITTSSHIIYESVNKCLGQQIPFFQKRVFNLLGGRLRCARDFPRPSQTCSVGLRFRDLEEHFVRRIPSSSIKSSTMSAVCSFALSSLNRHPGLQHKEIISYRLQGPHSYKMCVVSTHIEDVE